MTTKIPQIFGLDIRVKIKQTDFSIIMRYHFRLEYSYINDNKVGTYALIIILPDAKARRTS